MKQIHIIKHLLLYKTKTNIYFIAYKYEYTTKLLTYSDARLKVIAKVNNETN